MIDMTKKNKLLLYGGCKDSEKATKKYKKYNSPCESFPHQPATVITRQLPLLNKVPVFRVGCGSTVSNFWIMFPPKSFKVNHLVFLLHLPSDQIPMRWSFLNPTLQQRSSSQHSSARGPAPQQFQGIWKVPPPSAMYLILESLALR